ncbi:MAG: pyruvate kinase [Patescibacteria group bacterium]
MKTKIIATIGPATDSFEMLEKLALAGVDIMRNNFAHCKYDEYKERFDAIEKINKKHGLNIEVQADLRGPSIRLGENIPLKGLEVKEGQILKFVTEPCGEKEEDELIVTDPYLHADIKVGDQMLVESGMLELEIIEVNADSHKFKAKVKIGGIIFPRKALNLPNTKLTTSSLTEKDLRDLDYVLSVGVDWVAISFVSSDADVKKVREIIGDRPIKIMSKIEGKMGLANLDAIIEASDAIIVARGDLGVETPYEELPIVQKQMIKKCQYHLKPTIVATQMLKNMLKSPYPTRAEISDIANAVFDGAHMVWLSDESAVGEYPVEAVRVMKKVVERTNAYLESCSII